MNASVLRPLIVAAIVLIPSGCARAPAGGGAPPATAARSASAPPASATSLPSGIRALVLTGHEGRVTALAWSPDGTILASSSGDYARHDDTVRLWRADGTPVAVLRSPAAPVYSLAWSPDGTMLAAGTDAGKTRLWSQEGRPLATMQGPGSIFSVAWSPDGRTLATGASVGPRRNTVSLWDPRSGALLKRMYTDESGGKFYNLAWSPDGGFLAAGALDYKLWRSDGGEVYHSPVRTPAWALAWSPDSRAWVIGNENGTAFMYDTSGRLLAVLRDAHGNIDSISWSPDGRLLAGGDGITLWRRDGALVKVLAPGPSRVTTVAWSPTGRLLAAGTERDYGRPAVPLDNAVGIWTSDGGRVALLPLRNAVARVAWSPDGGILACGSGRAISLWFMP